MRPSHYAAASEEAEVNGMATHMVLHRKAEGTATLETTVDKILCPICRRRVFSCNEAVVRLKTRILVFENGIAYAKCKYCRNDVIVPLVMHESFDEEWLPVWDEGLYGETG